MENEDYQFVNVTMTLKLKPGSLKYLIPSIEEGMRFEDLEGIVYFESEVEPSPDGDE
jgi:hypothetical protein